ncbi:FxSxx-COOH system tetratricopeptide repeat protein [Streptomyces sp. NPDC006552]|uniref:FxSxx-COOH system tetratricopeptide repeat protein n=1 Tax=Streptomyces sp. NPDC006552 TaxID=3157179 RepID=UPI0033B4369E
MTDHPSAPDGRAPGAHGPRPPAGRPRLPVGELRWWEVADALWIAEQHPELLDPPKKPAPVPPRNAVPPRAPAPQDPPPAPGPPPQDAPEPAGAAADRATPAHPPPPRSPAEADGAEDGAEGGEPVPRPDPRPRRPARPRRRPGPSARELGRALRPFRQLRRTSPTDEVDEERTGEQFAEAPWLPPALRPAPEARWDVVLVVDGAPQMAVWRGTADRLAAVLRRYGGFRDIVLRSLDTDSTGDVVLRDPGRRGATHPVRSLVDQSGRRIVLVLTDGVAAAWRSGAVHSALALWGRHQPLAVLSTLPQRLWHRTGLRPERVRLHLAGRGAAGEAVRWEPAQPHGAEEWVAPLRRDHALAVPVLEVSGEWLSPWARFVAGQQPRWTEVAALMVVPGPPGAEPEPEATTPADATAAEQVGRFRVWASTEAFALAVRLAAVQLDLPVITAVQRAMLPRSEPVHLAELLMSGLVEVLPGDESAYVFRPGVREELLAAGTKRTTLQASRRAAEVLASRSGAARELLAHYDGREQPPEPEVTAENARFRAVEHAVLSVLAGEHLPRARRLGRLIAAHTETAPPTDAGERGGVISDETSRGTMKPHNSQNGPNHIDSTHSPHAPAAAPARREPGAPGPLQGGTPVTTVVPGTAAPAAEAREEPAGAAYQARAVRPAILGNMPPRNLVFTGRDDLLQRLEDDLGQGPTAVLPHTLHGMGGVGKSQLALEYVYRNAARYDVVWWIPAERPTQIAQALVELALRLDLPVTGEANTAVPAVLEALRTGRPYPNWLLVFDNAESPESVQNYFPLTSGGGSAGSILVTSRNPQWNTLAHPLEVDVFKREESIQLLQRRNPDLPDDEADRLASVLGDLPLAVEQASAWRAETGMPAEDYLRLFEEKRAELMAVSPPTQYEQTVATAWNVSLDHLEGKNSAALQLLQVCSYFAPEPIARSLFSGAPVEPIAPDLDRSLTDPLRLGRAIREINRYSLAKIDHRTNSIQMHRLVQAVLNARMSQEQRDRMQHGAHLLLAAATPRDPQDPSHWGRFGELYPHVVVSEAMRSPSRHVRQMVHAVAEFLYYWGDHEGSRDFSQRAYDSWCELHGEDDRQTLMLGRHLRYVLWALGRYREAAALSTRMLAVLEERPGSDVDDEFLRVRGLAASDSRASGDFTAARAINEEVYERAVRAYGDDDPETLMHAHNLGVSLRVTGDFRGALELDRQTWRRRTQMFGEDSLSSMLTESSIALDRRELGEYVDAVQLFEGITERYQLQIGANHPNTLRNVARLGVSLRKAGRHAEAAELTRRARKELLSRYGPEHPDSLVASLNLSVDLRQSGELTDSMRLGEATRDLFARVFGADHPHTLEAEMDLAITYRLLGKVDEARTLNESALARCTAQLGDGHPDALVCRINLASDLFAQGDAAGALALDEATLTAAKESLGANHPTVLVLISNLSQDLRALGRLAESEELRQAAVEGIGRVLGERHPAHADAVASRRANCDIDPMPI